jgi:hypothetical protein
LIIIINCYFKKIIKQNKSFFKLITPEKAIKLVANDVFRQALASPAQRQLPLWKGMVAGGGAGFWKIHLLS